MDEVAAAVLDEWDQEGDEIKRKQALPSAK